MSASSICPDVLFQDGKLDNTALYFYYTKLFPLPEMVEWLAYERSGDAGKKALARREFSLSLPADDGGEIYMRWLCFQNADSWLGRLIGSSPYAHKMDIGAIYSLPLSMKELQPHRFVPTEKEVVFDIDMNDYDHVRTCCSGKTICSKCWRFMTLAMRILDSAFRLDFGFKDILWVYSGRRGIHAWICDKAARQMGNEARVALVSYLTVVNERAHDGVGVRLFHRTTGLQRDQQGDALTHPVLERARMMCREVWETILSEQNVFGGKSDKAIESRSVFRQQLGHLGHCLENAMLANADYLEQPDYSVKLWRSLARVANSGDKAYQRLSGMMDEVAVGLTYPRLDVNVTKDVGHLLKSPFCAHPGTGRICVPIDPTLDGRDGRPAFDPKAVPTIAGLQEEYRKNDGLTSLQPHLCYFREAFLEKLVQNENDNPMQG